MDIRNTRQLKAIARERVANAPQEKKIVLIYSLIITALALMTTGLRYVLGLRMEDLGGLSNMAARSTLSTVQSMLPLVQSMVTMCLTLGYTAAMLRIARGQYSSPNTLRLGFDRFWVLLRCSIFKSLILTGVVFLSVYAGVTLFLLTPLAEPAQEILLPFVNQMTRLDTSFVIDDAAYLQLMQAMAPCFVICGILVLILGGPIFYSFRMTNYVIIDKPGMGALMALRESKKMMRGNRLQLLKLDISLWWYYLASAAAMAVCYGDVLLPLLGVELPVSGAVVFFGFYALYLATSFVILIFLRNRVEVTYALAYDWLKPEEKKDNGVVLGNIFQM